MVTPSPAAAHLATRLSFFVAGFGTASWAPLVPFAKGRLAIDDGAMGMLLLCLGLGSVISMSATGRLGARFGNWAVIMIGGLGVVAFVPLLAIVDTPIFLGAALFAFGAGLGLLDVAINLHAVDVERMERRPMMSGFHGLYSVGGFAGSASMTLMLSMGLTPLMAVLANAVLMLVAMAVATPRLLRTKADPHGAIFAMPHGVVLLLALLAAATFLAEGAMLDWSALLITTSGLVAVAQGGVGYMLFSIAMTTGRLVGDKVVARLGDRRVLWWGGLVAVAGFVVLLTLPVAWLALTGFVLIGLGASNIVPVLFRLAGAQKVMPAAQAIPALSTIGYAGILIGPAGVGGVAKLTGLHGTFWLLAGLFALTPLLARRVTSDAAPAS